MKPIVQKFKAYDEPKLTSQKLEIFNREINRPGSRGFTGSEKEAYFLDALRTLLAGGKWNDVGAVRELGRILGADVVTTTDEDYTTVAILFANR